MTSGISWILREVFDLDRLQDTLDTVNWVRNHVGRNPPDRITDQDIIELDKASQSLEAILSRMKDNQS